jgi:hypothetical protein
MEPRLHPEQIEAYRRMSPERKLEVAAELRRAAWDLKAAGIRGQHPDWTEQQVHNEVRRVFLFATT